MAERRKCAERRLSAAEEAQLSPEEFANYFGEAAKIVTNHNNPFDVAAEVMGRARDHY